MQTVAKRVGSADGVGSGRREESLLVVGGLRKAYEGVVAVDALDLKVAAGTALGLMGPNGAGKSTTVGCICGLVRPDAGSVSIGGHDVASDAIGARRLLGVAAQEIALYPDMTVATNLRFFGEVSGASPGDAAATVLWLAERLELRNKLGRRVRDLSVGQRRLVHVAAAMVHRPALLVLDEPTAGLDVSARTLLLALLRDVVADGTALLYSTHYLQEIEDLCSEALVLHEGHMLAAGSVASLIDRHGEGRVEVTVDGEVHVTEGADVATAVALAGRNGAVERVDVVPPSLEAVFLSLTGTRILEGAQS